MVDLKISVTASNLERDIITSLATSAFGAAAVKVALATGSRVATTGRDYELAQKLAATCERIETGRITEDLQTDTNSLTSLCLIDAQFYISPPEAAKSTHSTSCILALRGSGRINMMVV